MSTPGDQSEEAADHIADRVMQMPMSVQGARAAEPGEEMSEQGRRFQKSSIDVSDPTDADEEEADAVALKLADGDSTRIQERGETLNKKEQGRFAVTPEFQLNLENSKGRGQALDDSTKSEMKAKMRSDFSDVRIHTGTEAHNMSEGLNARAFTHGQDIYFNNSQSPQNKALLAHELAHTVQQKGNVQRKIQRAMKVEMQTRNFVWAVKDTGAPNALLLPRKYSPTTVGYKEGAGQEKGDQPAYLSVGPHGKPATPAGKGYVEVEGPPVMKEAKDADASKEAQFVSEFQFNTQVDVKDLLGKPVTLGQMILVKETDNSKIAAMAGKFNPNTFEFKYLNSDGSQLDVHLNQEGLFKKDHVKLMKVGKGRRKDIDRDKTAQKIETWKVTLGAGPVDFNGTPATVVQVGKTEDKEKTWKRAQAKNPKVKLEKDYNPGTYERNYFLSTDFSGDTLQPSAARLKVHLSRDGTSLKEGHVEFWEKKQVPKSEQTAIEVQSETDGVLEFETPKWFDDLSELKLRIQDAVDVTNTLNTATPLVDTDPREKKILQSMGRKTSDPLDKVVKWPSSLSTSHLKNLVKDKRSLFVQIVDADWGAKIQSSYEVSLSQYKTLLSEHDQWDGVDFAAATLSSGQSAFDAGFSDAKALTPAELKKLGLKDLDLTNVDKQNLVNLLALVQIITNYLIHGQYEDYATRPAKDIAQVMSRTSLYSMYHSILGKTERLLFQFMVKKDTITKTLEAPLNTFLAANKVAASPGAVPANFATGDAFVYRTRHRKGAGPKIKQWLQSIISGSKVGKTIVETDKLSPPDLGSKAMGAHKAGSEPGEENVVRFEVRYSQRLFGGQRQKASDWVKYIEDLFTLAAQRQDTPDNPLTPGVNEAAKTAMKS